MGLNSESICKITTRLFCKMFIFQCVVIYRDKLFWHNKICIIRIFIKHCFIIHLWRCCMCGNWFPGTHTVYIWFCSYNRAWQLINFFAWYIFVCTSFSFYRRFPRRCIKSLKLASDQPYQAFSINNWRTNRNTIHSLVQLFDSSYKGFSLLSWRLLYLS